MILISVLQNTNTATDRGSHLDVLIKRLANGDKDAMAELYTQTRSAVYGFSLSITKNGADAEDVLQDTYIKVWSASRSYNAKGTPMSWLLTIAKNLSLMKIRQRGKLQQLEPDEWESIAAEDTLGDVDDRHLLEAALNLLSDDERQIIMLHAVSGLKHREIASLLDMVLPTVLSKYHRALKKLRKYIEGVDAND